jgi:hypothetical protein
VRGSVAYDSQNEEGRVQLPQAGSEQRERRERSSEDRHALRETYFVVSPLTGVRARTGSGVVGCALSQLQVGFAFSRAALTLVVRWNLQRQTLLIPCLRQC